MAFESAILSHPIYAGLCLLVSPILFLVIKSRNARLEHIPGPFFAKYTDAWRAYKAWKYGDTDTNFYWQLIEKYGDVVRVGPRTVAVMDPEAVSQFMGLKARLDKGPAYDAFRSSAGVKTSLVSIPDDKTHGTYRRPVAHAYTLSSLKGYEGYIDEVINILVGVIDRHVERREPLNISAWLYYWAFDVIGKLSFGHPIGFLDHGHDFNGLIKAQQDLLKYINIPRASNATFLNSLLKGNPIYKWFKSNKPSPFINFARSRVQQRLLQAKTAPTSNENQPPDLLGHFIAAKENYPDIVTDAQILIYSGTNVAAGAFASSLVLDTMILFLAQQPSAQERLHQEVKSAESDTRTTEDSEGPAAFAQAVQMPYLEALILESYRYHTNFSNLLERVVSSKGLDLPNGQHLPPGTVVGTNPGAMNKRTDIYGADAGAFDPLRWMRRASESQEQFVKRRLGMERAGMTFGYGARSCIGKNIVQLELFKVMATLMRGYQFEAVGVPRPKQVWVNVKRREKV